MVKPRKTAAIREAKEKMSAWPTCHNITDTNPCLYCVGPTRTATSTMWLTRSALERSMGSVWSTSLAGPVRR